MSILDELKDFIALNAGHHISYSEEEAAHRLGYEDIETFRKLRKNRRIGYFRRGRVARYLPEHLDAFAKKHEVKAR